MKISKKAAMFAGILALIFLAYNLTLFVFTGFDHYASFWISYVFMLISFVVLACVGTLLGQRGLMLRDWLFGFPIIKHSVVYLVVEFAVSRIFMAIDSDSWKLAFVLQFLIMAVYLVFAISCFLAKETITEIEERVAVKTQTIRLLYADMQTAAQGCADAELKPTLEKLAEELRYSDPMSNEALADLERRLANVIGEVKALVLSGQYELAKQNCVTVANLINERNLKCKVLK